MAFSGSQYIKTKWPKFTTRPNTIEFRFAGANSGSGINNRYLLEGQDSGSDKFRWGILLRDNASTDSRGHIDFVLSGSNGFLSASVNDFPVYDTDFNSVMLTRKSSSGAELTSDRSNQSIVYTLYAKRYDAGRSKIYLEQTASLTITGSSYNTSYHSGSNKLYIGGLANSSGKSTYNKYTGSMMEFRIWKTALSESKFDNHVAAPTAYNGNHASASYTDLVTRFSFNDNKSFLEASYNTVETDKKINSWLKKMKNLVMDLNEIIIIASPVKSRYRSIWCESMLEIDFYYNLYT